MKIFIKMSNDDKSYFYYFEIIFMHFFYFSKKIPSYQVLNLKAKTFF